MTADKQHIAPRDDDEPLEPILEAFELAWRQLPGGEAPSLLEHARRGGGVRRRTLIELALLDMEYRWRSEQNDARAAALARDPSPLGRRPRWADYAALLAEQLPLRRLPAWAVAEQCRIVGSAGHDVDQDRLLSEFSWMPVELAGELAAVNREREADRDMRSASPASDPSRADTSGDPRAPLSYVDYQLQTHVGSGATGKVYRAWQRSLERLVAVKALHKRRQDDSQAVEQFVCEARAAARLRHDSIVGMHGLGRFPGGGYFLVMDWIEGLDLQQRLVDGRWLPRRAVDLAIHVSRAMEHAHATGVLHCDLKPANVLVDDRDRAYVTDFGMAVLQSRSAAAVGGTPAFMAPEQLDVTYGPLGPAADVFGVGGVLYAALTGHPPRTPAEPREALASMIARPIMPPDQYCDLPASLSALCHRCLAPAQAQRPSAPELTAALLQIFPA